MPMPPSPGGVEAAAEGAPRCGGGELILRLRQLDLRQFLPDLAELNANPGAADRRLAANRAQLLEFLRCLLEARLVLREPHFLGGAIRLDLAELCCQGGALRLFLLQRLLGLVERLCLVGNLSGRRRFPRSGSRGLLVCVGALLDGRGLGLLEGAKPAIGRRKLIAQPPGFVSERGSLSPRLVSVADQGRELLLEPADPALHIAFGG